MEHGASVASLVIVILAAFITPILLHRLKLNFIPVVIAEIIVGLIIGRSGFDLVQQDMWLETLSTLGFIFLMFLSGLEIDFSAFSNDGKKNRSFQAGNQNRTGLRFQCGFSQESFLFRWDYHIYSFWQA